jgi:hypothetical protein
MSRIIALALFAVLLAACDRDQPANGSLLAKEEGQETRLSQDTVAAGRTITVYKSPTCGCCGKWADHLEQNGFRVVVRTTEELGKIKREFGVPADMQSCHTAMIDDYVIEGHVPASDIEELLRRRPTQRILAVPGMPLGSPGMEHPNGSMPYESLLVADDGSVTVFERHGPHARRALGVSTTPTGRP